MLAQLSNPRRLVEPLELLEFEQKGGNMPENKEFEVEKGAPESFDVEELDDKSLEGVSGGNEVKDEFAGDPGNGCVNNAAHC